MSYPDTPLEGRVAGLDWGVRQEDGNTALVNIARNQQRLLGCEM